MIDLYSLVIDRQDNNQECPPYDAVLFDCDDTLVKSEKIAMGVAIDVIANVIEAQKPTANLNREQLVRDYAGWHFHKMITDLGEQHGVKLDIPTLDELKIGQTLEALKEVEELPGTTAAIERLRSHGVKVAVVTSSEFSRVNLCLEQTNLNRLFPEDHKFSAHDSITPPKHKPDPAVYNLAVTSLGLDKNSTIAIEDSLSGVKSADSAGLPVIGIVGSDLLPDAMRPDRAKLLIENGAKVVINHMDDLEAAMVYTATGNNIGFKHGHYTAESFTPSKPKPSRLGM